MIDHTFIQDTKDILRDKINGNKLFFSYEKYCKGNIEEAVKEWEEEKDNSLKALHHLVIYYHSEAIDSEEKNEIAKSKKLWKKTFTYWHELLSHDKFWQDYFMENVTLIFSRYHQDEVPEPSETIDKLKQDLPFLIVEYNIKQIEFYIEIGEDNHARTHYDLILKSLFNSNVKEKATKAVNNKFINLEVYNILQRHDPNSVETKNIQIANLKRLLHINPDSSDGIDLINKIYKNKLQNLCNIDTDGSEQRELNKILEESKCYLNMLNNENELKTECLDIRGRSLRSLKRYEDAISIHEEIIKTDCNEEYFCNMLYTYRAWCDQKLEGGYFDKALQISREAIDKINKEMLGRKLLSLFYYFSACCCSDYARRSSYIKQAEEYIDICEIRNINNVIAELKSSMRSGGY